MLKVTIMVMQHKRGWFGRVVTALVTSTKLIFVQPG